MQFRTGTTGMQSSPIESSSALSSAPVRRRVSKLSALALLGAGLTAPFITLPLDFQSVWPLFVLPILPLAAGILALVRIDRSRGRLRGQTFAMTAVVLSLVWLGSTLVLVSLGVHEGWIESPAAGNNDQSSTTNDQ